MTKAWNEINNRDVKFRVFDRPSQKMLYQDNYEFIFYPDGKFSVVEKVNTGNDYIKVGISDELNSHLMQFTGFFDKDNKEIYESDILEKVILGKTVLYEVIFQTGSWKTRTKVGNSYEYNHLATTSISSMLRGNIYQNQDLL